MNHNHHHHHHVEEHHVSPGHVTIGIKREGLDFFDDLQTLEKHPAPYRIHKIKGISFLISKFNSTKNIFWVFVSLIWLLMAIALKDMISPSSSPSGNFSVMFMKKLSRSSMMMIFLRFTDEQGQESMKSDSKHTRVMPKHMDTLMGKFLSINSLGPHSEQYQEDMETI